MFMIDWVRSLLRRTLAAETVWLKNFVDVEEENDAEGAFLALSAVFDDENNLSPPRIRPDGSVRFVIRDFYSRMADEVVTAC
jgi:hypothetical protein